jgi:hypothetical protein
MRREAFAKLVDETDLILDKLSEAFYADPVKEQERKRVVVRSGVSDGFLVVFARMEAPGLAPEER